MDHSEVGIRPVWECGPFVTVGHGIVGGHRQTNFLGAFFRHLPDDHGVRLESRSAVVQHSAETPHDAPVLEVFGHCEKFAGVEAQPLG